MLKRAAKFVLLAKAGLEVLKEKAESKAAELFVQAKAFGQNLEESKSQDSNIKSESRVKGKTKQTLNELITEVCHKAQINELQFRGFVKDKLIELTNNALLDSSELNDIRAEIASLHAEISDLKSQIKTAKR